MSKMIKKSVAGAVIVAISVSGCAQVESGLKSMGDQNILVTCAGVAAGAAVITEFFSKLNPKATPTSSKDHRDKLLKAAAVGCAIGVAATAVGRVLNARQQTAFEEAAQRNAKRQAQEGQNITAIETKYDKMAPARTTRETEDRERRRQDELTKARERYAKPETIDLGEGTTTTFAPANPQIVSNPADGPGCFRQAASRSGPSGQARQVDIWCPNDRGIPVRVESQEVNASV